MNSRPKRFLGLPALLLGTSLLGGCGSGDPNAGMPPPRPATPEELKKADDDYRASQGGMKSPGINAP